MQVIDAQVHVWYTDRPSRPWSTTYRAANRDRPSYLQHAGQTNSASMAIEEMREAGVDGALLTSLGIYGDTLDVELDAINEHPARFRAIGVADPAAPTPADRLSALRAHGLLGIRIPELRTAERTRSGEFDRVLAACDDLELTVMLPALNTASADMFRRYPNIFFFLNHLGLGSAPPIVGFGEVEPFARLTEVCEYASHPNVGLKLTGTPALSTERYPFRDIWEPVRQVIAAYGADRVAWGSDYTRTAGLHSYWEGTHYLREISCIAADDLALLYGGSLALRTRWNDYQPERK